MASGSKDWPSKKDLDYFSGTRLTPSTGVELPALKSGDATTVSFDANAPHEPGYYEMKWKVEGGLCFPFTDILVAAIARTLKDNPLLNSTVREDDIVVWEDINIGVAVAIEGGLAVVMNRCVKIEHARQFGGLNWAGVNTGVISAKRGLPA